MNSKLKVILSLVLAVIMALPLAACGQSSADQPKETSPSAAKDSPEAVDATAGEIDTSEFAKITMLVLGNKPTNGRLEDVLAAENEIFKERINAELSLQYIEWADWQTNYQLALASGDTSIDMIITATDWLYAWPSVRKGAFLPLSEEMLSTYAPNTWEEVSSEHWDACTMDDQIWFIPEDQYTQWTNHGMYYRGDWAEEAGIGTVTNFEELEKYFDFVLEDKPDVIPWDVSGANNQGGLMAGYLQEATETSGILGAETGNFNVFFYDNSDPYSVVSPIVEGQELVDYAVMMKRWADKGIWREDVLNYQGETRDLMYAGSSGADQHHTQTYVFSTRPEMDKNQPGSDLQFFYWGYENGNFNRDLITHGAMAINAASPNPERALMMYDLIRNDEEVYRLHNFGIEGIDYLVVDDQYLGRPDGWDATIDSLDTNFWAGRMDKYELENEIQYEDKDVLYAEMDGKANDYQLIKFAFDPSNVTAEMAGLADVCATYIPSIAYGKVEDPEVSVENFRKELIAAGYEAVKAELQSQLDELKTQEG